MEGKQGSWIGPPAVKESLKVLLKLTQDGRAFHGLTTRFVTNESDALM